VLLHDALYLWRIVIASDINSFGLFAGIIALSLQVSIIASLRYCSEQHTQALSFLKKRIILAITLPSSVLIPLPTLFTGYVFYCKIFKTASIFLRYYMSLCPNVET
jgi:hypothetical protein